jgi:metaxin
VQPCATASASPTGVLPAIERAGELGPSASSTTTATVDPFAPANLAATTRYISPPPGPHDPAAGSDLAAARLAIDFLRQPGGGGRTPDEGSSPSAATSSVDLDAALSPAQRADAAALCSLICARLDPATLATTWLEPEGWQAFRAAVYSPALPFPLSWAVPWQERQRQLGRLRGTLEPAAAYELAVGALAVLDQKLSSSGGPYLLGTKPCTADALLFGHALFWRRSSVAAPVLKAAVAALPAIEAFLARALAGPFGAALPPAATLLEEGGGREEGGGGEGGAGAAGGGRGGAGGAAGAWSRAARGQAPRPAPPKPPPTEEELRMRRGSALWLGGAAAALGAYVLTSGQFFEIVEVDDDDDDGDDGDEAGDGDEGM